MQIRDLEPTDLADAYAINQGEVPAVGDATPEHFADLAAMAAIKLAAVDTDDAEHPGAVIAGFCLVLTPGADYDSGNYLWFSERYHDFVYLDRVAISPRYQRRGIGRALYSTVVTRAATVRPHAAALTLEVNIEPRNDASLAFHEALGFTEVGQRDTHYGTRVALLALSL